MKFDEVQASVRANLDKLIEMAPSEELRLLAEEIKTDLESTEITTCFAKFQRRGREMNRLTSKNQALLWINGILLKRLSAIQGLSRWP